MQGTHGTIGGRHVSWPFRTTLQEEEMQVDHVEDISEGGTGQKVLIPNRKKKNLDEWQFSKGRVLICNGNGFQLRSCVCVCVCVCGYTYGNMLDCTGG